MEETTGFKDVEDLFTYVKKGIESGELVPEEVKKTARIQARQGEVGQEVVTVMKNGLEETKNVVQLDEKTGEPGWIATNPDGEEYIIGDSTFKERYEMDPENPGTYVPKGAPVLSVKVDESIRFTSPWGQDMKLVEGGMLIISQPDKIYGIQEEEFHNTYGNTEKSAEEALKEAEELFGIERLVHKINEDGTITLGESLNTEDGEIENHGGNGMAPELSPEEAEKVSGNISEFMQQIRDDLQKEDKSNEIDE